MNKEHLLKQKQAIDAALAAIEQQESEAQELQRNQERMRRGLYVPLKHASVKRDMFFVTGDERIEVEGYCTAREILGSPAFKENERLVLIRTESNMLMWTPQRADGNYEQSDEDHTLTEDEADGYITIIEQ